MANIRRKDLTIFDDVKNKNVYFRAAEMDFKVEEPQNTEKYYRPLAGWQEKFLNSRRSRMAKAVTFWYL